MPSLKDIRRRIRSVKSTQKITQAMKMVAAAKVKRAENRVKANRPYAAELRNIFRDVYESLKNQTSQLDGSRYQTLLRERPVKNLAIVVLTSDRGLCGSYNANIIKQALHLDRQYKAQGINPKFYLVGNKIIRSFPQYSDSEILGTSGNISAAPTVHDAQLIAQSLVSDFHAGKIDAIHVLYTRFISMISYKVTLLPVFPMKGIVEEIEHEIMPVEETYSSRFEMDGQDAHHHHPAIRGETLLEPSPTDVLDSLVPLYLTNQFYISLLEASASELAARMTAMSNASNNASDMIAKLTIIYNKARQASITQEILEIVSGAEALS